VIPAARLEQLNAAYEQCFGMRRRDAYLVVAPGRVNLIGEHIDYNGLAVLPMAIQRNIALLSSPRTDGAVRVANISAEFGTRSFEVESEIEPFPPGDWGNYAKAAVQALAARFGAGRGFDAVLGSDLPVAAGLSSSSALLVATALAFVTANDIVVQPLELMELAAEAERYVGTRGGGMDQAICLGAVEQAALRVEFDPVRFTPRRIPADWRFVVISSRQRAEKSGAARDIYNRRTQECREALASVLSHLDLPPIIDSYSGLLGAVGASRLLDIGDGVLDDALRRRFRHVVTESTRVNEAEAAMAAEDLGEFGRVLTESHASLRDDYEVSTPGLDGIVEAALAAGADGARLTGAGLGGCAVAACSEGAADSLVAGLAARYDHEDQVFVAEPSGGASVIAL
jgi:galactokinase